MTREEAIKGLKVLAKDFSGYKPNEEMFDMAIKALEQPECEDAVSRFEVLRLIDYSSHDLNDAVDNRYMQNEIKQLPSVTPNQPGWTPCSTEMPPTGKNVLVTLVDGAVTDGQRWKPQEGKWFLFSDGVNGLDEDVLAWMPLPAPYCPEGENSERHDQ